MSLSWSRGLRLGRCSFGDPVLPLPSLLTVPLRFGFMYLIRVGIAALVCQGFYSYRIYVMSKRNPVIPIFVMVLSVVSFGE